MQRLTAMTLGALCIGAAGFFCDMSNAQTRTASVVAAPCPDREVSIYFEKDETEFNTFTKALVDRVAQEAKACGAKQIVAKIGVGPRATAMSNAFQPYGIKLVVVGPPSATPQAQGLADRMATLRVAPANQRIG